MRKVKLGDVCTINPKSATYSDDHLLSFIPMASVGENGEIDVSETRSYCEVKKGFTGFVEDDVLFAKITPCMENGKGAIAHGLINEAGFGSTEFHVLRPDKQRITSKWLYYLTSWQIFRMEAEKNMTGSAGQKRVPKSFLESYEITLPTIEQQQAQSKALDKVIALIKLHQQQLTKLDELVKSRFIELFGGVGTDTKGWGLKQLGDCCTINPKKGEDKRLHQDLMVSFVPMPAVSEKGEIDASETKSYNEVKTGFTYFAEQDVLFAKITPCMENGKGAVAKGLCNGVGFGSTEFHVLRPIEGVSNPYWIYAVTAFKQFRVDAANNMTGSAGQRRVPASFLEAYKVSLPPIDLQNQFAAFVEQTDKSKLSIQQSLDRLETLKKALMQEYFG